MDPSAALRVYAEVSLATRTPRELEANAFNKSIRLLEEAGQALPDDFLAYAKALHFNQSLWTIILADVSSDTTLLPLALRENLITLARFVERETVNALSHPDVSHLRPLININQQLMEGLREQSSSR